MQDSKAELPVFDGSEDEGWLADSDAYNEERAIFDRLDQAKKMRTTKEKLRQKLAKKLKEAE